MLLLVRWFGVLVLAFVAIACSKRQLATSHGTGTLDGGIGHDGAGAGTGAGGSQGGAGGAGGASLVDAGVTPGLICSRDRWCWINPLPAAGLDGASWSFSADDAWLVGRAGSILRWRSGVWSAVESGTSENLKAVWGADATEAWAIGDRGTILRWDGLRWSPVVSPVTTDLLCISGVGRGDIWAMGADGRAIHWGGTVWSEVEAPATNGQALTGVFAASPTSVFAVSQSGIFHWDGSWSRAPAEFSGFSAIWGAHDSDVWAVGRPDNWEFPAGRAAMAHWDGTKWAFVLPPGGALTGPFGSVWGTGSGDVWATSAGLFDALAHFDGSMWSWATRGSPGAIINGQLGGGRGAVFVTNLAEISQFERAAWQRRSSGQTFNVNGMWMQSPTDGWVIADGSVVHWDGSTLSTPVAVQPATTLYAIHGTRSDDVWAVGAGGVIAHWNGVEWTATQLSDVASMYVKSVWSSSPRDVWATAWWGAAAPGGKILHNDGSGWTVAMSSDITIGSVWGTSANDVWIGRFDGRALHWDGDTWTTIETPVKRLDPIASSGPNDVWAIGTDIGPNVIVHWDGAAWTRSPGGDRIGQLISLSAAAPDNVWAVGYSGALARWDGTTWAPSRVTFNFDLHAVFVLPDGTTWIGGNAGAILRRSPPLDWR